MNDVTELLNRLRTERPLVWEQLPDFSLYMDQILSYMDRQVLNFSEDDALTAAMVNNYTKSGLVPRAEGKKYNRDHLAYLTVICILKRVMSAKDMDLLIREELENGRNVQQGYADFCNSLDQAMELTANRIESRPEDDTLADAAIHFALLSYVTGLASSRYVAMLREQKEAAGELPPAKGRKKEKEKN